MLAAVLQGQVLDPVTGLPFADPALTGEETPSDSLPDDSEAFDISDAKVELFRPGQPFSFVRVDTSVNRYQDFDPAFRGRVDRQTLGNLGSASQPLLFGTRGTVGFDLSAANAWSPYYRNPDSLRFWRANKPYTQARYTLGAGVQQMLGFRHVRNLVPNLNVSFDYRRTVSEGQTNRLKAGVHDLGVSAWFRSPDKRYTAQVGYVFRSVEAQENGGVTTEDVFDFTPRTAAPVRLEDAFHEQRGQTVFVEQSWYLGKRSAAAETVPDAVLLAPGEPPAIGLLTPPDTLLKQAVSDTISLPVLAGIDSLVVFDSMATTDQLVAADSLALPPLELDSFLPPPEPIKIRRPPIIPAWRAWHRIAWSTDQRRFQDDDPDSLFYPGLWPGTDTLLADYGFTRLENTIGFGTAPRGARSDAPADSTAAWEASVRGIHRYDRIQRTAGFYTQQDALLDVRVALLPPLGRGGFLFRGHGRANVRGEYRLSAEAGFRTGKHRLSGTVESTRLQPADQEIFFATPAGLWENDFNAETRLVPGVRYKHTGIGLNLEARYHLVADYLYWDAEGLPAQGSGTLGLWQGIVQQNFRFGKFRWDNTVALQQTASDNINVPLYWGRHSLYFAGRLFGDAMFAHLGADVRYGTSYNADAWNPVSATFQLQNSHELTFYPVVDVFLAAYISRARILLKGYNLTQGLFEPGWYQTPEYPMPNRGFVLQIDWVFWY